MTSFMLLLLTSTCHSPNAISWWASRQVCLSSSFVIQSTVVWLHSWSNLVSNDAWLCNLPFAGPRSKSTHWKQTVLYLEDVVTICEGETLSGSMTVANNKKNPRDIDITLKYAINGNRCKVSRTQHYKMRWPTRGTQLPSTQFWSTEYLVFQKLMLVLYFYFGLSVT